MSNVEVPMFNRSDLAGRRWKVILLLLCSMVILFICYLWMSRRNPEAEDRDFVDLLSLDADASEKAALRLAMKGDLVLPRLVTLLETGNENEQASAASVLWKMDVAPAAPRIEKIVLGADAARRFWATLATWTPGSDVSGVYPVLEEAVRGPSSYRRYMALDALLARTTKPLHPTPALVAAIDARLDDSAATEDYDDTILIDSLLSRFDAGGKQLLLESLARHKGGKRRISAVFMWGRGDEGAIAVLKAIAADPGASYRESAAAALSSLATANR